MFHLILIQYIHPHTHDLITRVLMVGEQQNNLWYKRGQNDPGTYYYNLYNDPDREVVMRVFDTLKKADMSPLGVKG